MEGLIPLVIHAIKKSRKRSKYRSLSQGSSGGFAGVDLSWFVDGDGGACRSTSHHTNQCRWPAMTDQLQPPGRVADVDHLHGGRHLALVVLEKAPPPPQAAAGRSGNKMRRTASGSIW